MQEYGLSIELVPTSRVRANYAGGTDTGTINLDGDGHLQVIVGF